MTNHQTYIQNHHFLFMMVVSINEGRFKRENDVLLIDSILFFKLHLIVEYHSFERILLTYRHIRHIHD